MQFTCITWNPSIITSKNTLKHENFKAYHQIFILKLHIIHRIFDILSNFSKNVSQKSTDCHKTFTSCITITRVNFKKKCNIDIK